jgi:hypothetical protein
MDKMKRESELDVALLDIAKGRDQRLRKSPALSAARHAILTDCLVETFPMEATLHRVATKRDQLLDQHPPRVPLSTESALHRQVGAVGRIRDGAVGPVWLRAFRSPLGLAVCVVITAAILYLGKWGMQSRRNAETVSPTSRPAGANVESGAVLDRLPMGRADLFARRVLIRPFNLNAKEPASLQASLLANSSVHFADGIETPFGLRLDLPVRAFLTEDSLSRIP